MFARMSQQSRGEFFPRLQLESKAAEKFRLVLSVAMRGRKQVMGDLSAWNDRAFSVGQFHICSW
jgi:hypothetical protein